MGIATPTCLPASPQHPQCCLLPDTGVLSIGFTPATPEKKVNARKKNQMHQKKPPKLLHSVYKTSLDTQSGKSLLSHHAKTRVESLPLLPGTREQTRGTQAQLAPRLRAVPGHGLQGESRAQGSR